MESLTVVELSRCVRDLIALAMLPALWRQADAKQTTENLSDVVLRTLEADLVYVLVREPAGDHEASRTTGDHDLAATRELLAPVLRGGEAVSRLDVFGTEMNALLQPIDIPGSAPALVVVATKRASFPTDIERALLRVAANQASVVLQNARHVGDLDRAARAREQLLEELAAASRRKDHFLAVLGHELRNPLAAIHAAHTHSLTTGDHVRAREIITHQLSTLTRLVDDLLDASRVSTGKLGLQKTTLDLRKVIEKARAVAEHAAAAKGHQLSIELPPAPLWVDGDSVRLEQVTVNLLGNAIRYSPEGSRIAIAAAPTSDGSALVRVEDNGNGIAPELLPRIFEPFVQADMALHRTGGGLGLGLALVKGVVELHGGDVSITSPGTGKGCTVELRLPLVAPAAVEAVTAMATATAVTAEPRSRKLRVLLVDDNVDITEMLTALLELTGHSVAYANDGEQALELAARFAPDVAFVDIGLPGLDGYEVARRLRAKMAQGVRLIAMSGYGQPDDRARSAEAGFDDHLVKPVPIELIEEILATVTVRREPT